MIVSNNARTYEFEVKEADGIFVYTVSGCNPSEARINLHKRYRVDLSKIINMVRLWNT